VGKILGALGGVGSVVKSGLSFALHKIAPAIGSELVSLGKAIWGGMRKIVPTLNRVVAQVKGLGSAMYKWVSGKWAKAFSWLQQHIPELARKVAGKVKQAAVSLEDRIRTLWDILTGKVKKGAGAVLQLMKDVGHAVVQRLFKAKDLAKELVRKGIDRLLGEWYVRFQDLADYFAWRAGRIKGSVSRVLKRLVRTVFYGAARLLSLLKVQHESTLGALKTLVGKMWSAYQTHASRVWRAIKKLTDSVWHSIKVLSGRLRGLKQQWESYRQKLNRAVKHIKDWLKKQPGWNIITKIWKAIDSVGQKLAVIFAWRQLIERRIRRVGEMVLAPVVLLRETLGRLIRPAGEALEKVQEGVAEALGVTLEKVRKALDFVYAPLRKALMVPLLRMQIAMRRAEELMRISEMLTPRALLLPRRDWERVRRLYAHLLYRVVTG